MATPPIPDELLDQVAAAYSQGKTVSQISRELGWPWSTTDRRLKEAASKGMLGTGAVLPGFTIARVTNTPKGDFIQQRPEAGQEFEVRDGHAIKGVSALVDAEGRVINQWVKTSVDEGARHALMLAAIEALKEDLPRMEAVAPPDTVDAELCNTYVVTDSHFGALAWWEETGADYDLKIAERVLLDWFSEAIRLSPSAHTGIFAQLGDLLHHDALESVTPLHRHVLDADSRLQKVIRVVIRTVRRVIGLLLEKHAHVHIIMAEGNHDPASSAWLREMLAAMYENEPRIKVDTSPKPYYAFEWGKTSLFFHHGHRRGIKNVDSVFAAEFRELFGRTTHAYAHLGHRHNDQLTSSNLMKIEQHETLAARDAYASSGGWLSGRTAKVITYSTAGGEVFRNIVPARLVRAG